MKERASSADISEVFSEGQREPAAHMTISQDVVEPFAFHMAVIGIAVLIGRAIVWGFGKVFGYAGLPLFPFAMIGGLIINQIAQRTSLKDMFDRKIFQRIQGMALEVLVIGAMASIKVPVVIAYWAPLLITSIAVVLMMLVWFFWLSPRIFSDNWFEHGIIRFGAFSGVAAVGYMLLRTADPKMETDAGSVYALDGPFMSPFIGGGLVTTAYPYLINRFGSAMSALIFCGASLAIILFLRIFFWKKDFKMEQR